jgi:hypothetical protein
LPGVRLFVPASDELNPVALEQRSWLFRVNVGKEGDDSGLMRGTAVELIGCLSVCLPENCWAMRAESA